MWRRRQLQQPAEKPGQIPTGPLLRRLQAAHRLLEEGQYLLAAEAFEDLARGAQIRDPERAPQFYLQAARAYLLAGNIDPAMQLIYHGLGLLANGQKWFRLRKYFNQADSELRARGYTSQADALGKWLYQQLVPPEAQEALPQDDAEHPALPTACPSCGAPLHPAEIEWVDEKSAECAFCGAIIRAEQSV